ncbi:MAG: hypothetical protein RIS47_1245, partial [Bacteroidota bacterium]
DSEDVKGAQIARVFDKYLYEKDVADLISAELSAEDSTRIVEMYIDQWIKKQLLIKKAEINLSDDQKEIDQEIEDYRSALLIDRYLEVFTQQKLDTNVSEDEMATYYKAHTPDFKLASNVVRAVFMQLPTDVPDVDQLKQWLKSDDKEDLVRIDDYGYTNAVKFKTYNHDWIPFSTLQIDLPKQIDNPTDFLENKNLIESRDSLYYYIAYIKEHRIEGQQTPLDFVRDKIKKVLLTKRKAELINELKANIYKDGYSHEYFEIIPNKIEKKNK